MRTKTCFLMMIFLLAVNVAWGEEPMMTITDAKVDPGTVGAGGTILISCRVTHSVSPNAVERVAATVFAGNRVAGYQMLYDDGTNGDKTAYDGVYSLEIEAPKTPGEAKVVFNAVDTEKNETESEPVVLMIQ
ncbi:MAG: choice-of-anchor X domain-containing protein [Pseudomonadota bacterium]